MAVRPLAIRAAEKRASQILAMVRVLVLFMVLEWTSR
jgi:hypothetical protein